MKEPTVLSVHGGFCGSRYDGRRLAVSRSRHLRAGYLQAPHMPRPAFFAAAWEARYFFTRLNGLPPYT